MAEAASSTHRLLHEATLTDAPIVLAFPLVLHFVDHDGGRHDHVRIRDAAALRRYLRKIPGMTPTLAARASRQILDGEPFPLDEVGLDAVVWATLME